jgi:putative hemolysin
MKNTILALLAIAALAVCASALRNPASIYCDAAGYKYVVEATPQGEMGYCQLDAGTKVEAWKFLQGKEAPEKSYCTQKGYKLKTVNDAEKCAMFGLPSCSVCVLADGSEVEVTQLMNLTFTETTCGDGTCGFPENYKTCPKDCPSGGLDGICDGAADGRCDPDCLIRNTTSEDKDCVTTTTIKAAATTTTQKAATTTMKAPTTTIAANIPLEQPKSTGCLPLLLAPLSLLACAFGKALRLF